MGGLISVMGLQTYKFNRDLACILIKRDFALSVCSSSVLVDDEDSYLRENTMKMTTLVLGLPRTLRCLS